MEASSSLLSAEGKGSTFQVHLPAVPEGKEADVADAAALAPLGNGELILVVDDETSIRDVIRSILIRHGLPGGHRKRRERTPPRSTQCIATKSKR